MEFIVNNLPEALMIIGVIALIIEVAVLGLSTFILLFLGISLFSTGLMMNVGLLEASMTTALWSNTLITSACAILLWKPLKRMQDNVDNKEVKSDFAELDFIIKADVNDLGLTTHAYSGIDWKLKSHQPLCAGTHVKVIKKEVGVMWVEAI
ncbi:NfeD family protein [Pseudoalteromonas sp. H105]|jgi:membrane protein implicated in regulation of membrane protease activity|uniref:NfeD family protein n=1 Tax=Pseudoalteromonas sp. H105 TaxID=1348393 RepID=UPI000731F36E|nr:hypothetical protein [Pseudoalteromonas sp. H105]KTF16643.1 activity regulator of membrane protease YbbK [Pseudoalteromonas sp. H105]